MLAGYFFVGSQKRIGSDDPFALLRNLFRQEPHHHQLVLHARAQNFCDLAEHARDLVQPRDVILVMLHRIERNRQRQIGEIGVNAALGGDRHLVFFEPKIGNALLEDANQQVVRKLVLIGESLGRDGLQPLEKRFVRLVPLGNRVERVVGEPVVVAVVPERSRALRKIAQICFVLLVEKTILCGQAVGHRLVILGKNRNGYSDQNRSEKRSAHRNVE